MSAVDVVVVSYQGRDLLLRCCRSVGEHAPEARLLVVDNASTDDSAAAITGAWPQATVLELATNLGFAAACNRGVAAGAAPLVLLLNPDAELTAGALASMALALQEDEGCAAAGPQIRGPGGELELSVGRTMSIANDIMFKLLGPLRNVFPLTGILERRYRRSRTVASLSGACLLVRREAWEAVGGMDEAFFLYAEDVDLCHRLRQAGWRLRYVAEARVRHARGAVTGRDPAATRAHFRASQRRFYEKHRPRLQRTLLSWWQRLSGGPEGRG